MFPRFRDLMAQLPKNGIKCEFKTSKELKYSKSIAVVTVYRA